MTARASCRVLLAALVLLAGCAGPRFGAWPGPSFRLGSLEQSGDPARRASVRLLLEGLADDSDGRPDVALGHYERALQVDPTNPYAYLALARHHAESVEPRRALAFLDRAEALLGQEAPVPPGVEAHLVGLRGAVLHAASGGRAGLALLERARALDPAAWSDARLSAWELR